MNKNFANILGWYGAVAILVAYALVSFSFISANSMLFQIINLTGAVGIIVISLYKKVYQSVVLNVVWTIIALVAIINILK